MPVNLEAVEAEIVSSLAHGRSTTAVAAKFHVPVSMVESLKAKHGPDLGQLARAAATFRGENPPVDDEVGAELTKVAVLNAAAKIPALAARAARINDQIAQLRVDVDLAAKRAAAEQLVAKRREELAKAEALLAETKGRKPLVVDEATKIREWAKTQGLKVSERGRISEAIRLKYEERER